MQRCLRHLPTAICAALKPTTPPPMMVTLAGITPGTPPSSRAAFHQFARLFEIGREVEIGEQDLPFAQHRAFDRLRFLDLHHHLASGEDLGRGRHQRRAGGGIGGIVGPDADTGTFLDDKFMAEGYEFPDTFRGQSDPVFMGLDFANGLNAHGTMLQWL